MALKSRIPSLEHAAAVTDCGHDTAEIAEFVSGRGPRDSYTYLGKGISKTAYLMPCGKHVLKFGDVWQTKAERDLWDAAPAALKRILSPVRAFGMLNGWAVIVTDRADTIGWSDTLPRKFRRMVETARRYGIRDIHAGNVGIIRGRCVMIDYGIADMNLVRSPLHSATAGGYVRSASLSPVTSWPSPVTGSAPKCRQCGQAFTCCDVDHRCQVPSNPFRAKYPCGECGVSFHFRSNRDAHEARHTRNVTKRLYCPECHADHTV